MTTNEIPDDDIAHLMTKQFHCVEVGKAGEFIVELERQGWSLHGWTEGGQTEPHVTMLFTRTPECSRPDIVIGGSGELQMLLEEVVSWRERNDEEYVKCLTGVGTGHAERSDRLGGAIEAFKKIEELIRRRLPHRP